jgi:hypothetical protein
MSNAPLRTLAEIEADLSAPIPDEYLGTKTKGGRTFTIFTWMVAQGFLNKYAPGWHGHATLTYSGERVGCVYQLCIPTSDYGLVCRAASGDDQEDDDEVPEFETTDERKKWESEQRQRQFGTPTTRAEGQAFKRAAARFGLGMYLRSRSVPTGNTARSSSNGSQATAHQPFIETPEMANTLIERLKVHFNAIKLSNEERRQVFQAVTGKSLDELKENVTALRIATERIEAIASRQDAIDLVDTSILRRPAPAEPTLLRRRNA